MRERFWLQIEEAERFGAVLLYELSEE